MRHSVHIHLPFHTHHRPARYDVDMTKGNITRLRLLTLARQQSIPSDWILDRSWL